MGEHGQDTANAGGGPLEAALQDDAPQTEQTEQTETGGQARMGNQAEAPSGDAGIFDAEGSGAGGAGAPAPTGRASFTTPGAVSSIHDMAAKAESFSDPIAGEAEAGAEMLEQAKREM